MSDDHKRQVEKLETALKRALEERHAWEQTSNHWQGMVNDLRYTIANSQPELLLAHGRIERLRRLLAAALRSRRSWMRPWNKALEDLLGVRHVYSSYFRTESEGAVSVRLYVERCDGTMSKSRLRELVGMGMPGEEEEEAEEKERRAFEHWMSDEGKHPKAVERNKDGGYRLSQTASSWVVWKAGARGRKCLL